MKSSHKPNILVIMTDQQHFRMMGCAGNTYVVTPAMDSIAAGGIRFSRAYCTNPVCVPSRFSLVTGRYPSEIGMRNNESKHLPPLPDEMKRQGLGWLLREAGYETFFGGKEHFPKQVRATEFGFQYLTGDEREQLARVSADFLQGRAGNDTPFCYVASFINPHDICYMAIRDFAESDLDQLLLSRGKEELAALDDALKLPEGVTQEEFFERHCPPAPPNFEPQTDEPEAITMLQAKRAFKRKSRAQWSEERWRLHRWAYKRLTERVDAQIGRVLEALNEAGLDENTMVIFTSDHGDMDSAHRMEHKTAFYDEAVRIPLLIRWPGVTPRGTVDTEHLISNGLDLLPTLCDIAGARIPEGLQGRSLKPLLEDPAGLDTGSGRWRDALLVESEIGNMAVTHGYKYMLHDKGARAEQLMDLEADPWETANHAADPANASILDEHRSELRRLRGNLPG